MSDNTVRQATADGDNNAVSFSTARSQDVLYQTSRCVTVHFLQRSYGSLWVTQTRLSNVYRANLFNAHSFAVQERG